jgi:outer membrane murein-binding lipoprotein Lpp
MNKLFIVLAVMLLTIGFVGCETEQHKEQVAADQKHLADTIKGVNDDLQWKLDDATATRIFENDKDAVGNYMKFRKCHVEPPTNEANKKVCAVLRGRVARAEAKAEAQQKREKANW